MKTCETCLCWRKIGSTPAHRHVMLDTGPLIIPPGDEGLCRFGPPREDFRWPLTKASDGCAQHRADKAESEKLKAETDGELFEQGAAGAIAPRGPAAASGEPRREKAEATAKSAASAAPAGAVPPPVSNGHRRRGFISEPKS
jgi:hypothetical protein